MKITTNKWLYNILLFSFLWLSLFSCSSSNCLNAIEVKRLNDQIELIIKFSDYNNVTEVIEIPDFAVAIKTLFEVTEIESTYHVGWKFGYRNEEHLNRDLTKWRTWIAENSCQ